MDRLQQQPAYDQRIQPSSPNATRAKARSPKESHGVTLRARCDTDADIYPQKKLPPSTPIGANISISAPSTPGEGAAACASRNQSSSKDESVRTKLFAQEQEHERTPVSFVKPDAHLKSCKQKPQTRSGSQKQSEVVGGDEHERNKLQNRRRKRPSSSAIKSKPSSLVGTPIVKEEVHLFGKDPCRAAPDRATVAQLVRHEESQKQRSGTSGIHSDAASQQKQNQQDEGMASNNDKKNSTTSYSNCIKKKKTAKKKGKKHPIYLTGSFSPPLSRRETGL